jgi:hypothetical protein
MAQMRTVTENLIIVCRIFCSCRTSETIRAKSSLLARNVSLVSSCKIEGQDSAEVTLFHLSHVFVI